MNHAVANHPVVAVPLLAQSAAALDSSPEARPELDVVQILKPCQAQLSFKLDWAFSSTVADLQITEY